MKGVRKIKRTNHKSINVNKEKVKKRKWRNPLSSGLIKIGLGIASIGIAAYLSFQEVKDIPIKDVSVFRINNWSVSSCYICEGPENSEKKMEDGLKFMNWKNDRWKEIIEEDFYIFHKKETGLAYWMNKESEGVYGYYVSENGNIHAFEKMKAAGVAHELLHKAYDRYFKGKRKKELKEILINLYLLSSMPPEKREEIITNKTEKKISPEFKGFLDGVKEWYEGYEYLIEEGKWRMFEEEATGELFAYAPFLETLGIPDFLSNYYYEVMDNNFVHKKIIKTGVEKGDILNLKLKENLREDILK